MIFNINNKASNAVSSQFPQKLCMHVYSLQKKNKKKTMVYNINNNKSTIQCENFQSIAICT